MKSISVLFVFIILSFFQIALAQKKEKEPKINYKVEILPLLQNAKTDEAIPLLKKYYAQNVVLGDIWKPKVLLLEVEYMHNAEKLIAKDYDSRAFKNYSTPLADTSIIWYKKMLMDRHPDSLLAKERIGVLTKSKAEFPTQLATFQKQKEIDEANRKKFYADSIEKAKIAKEKRDVFVKDSTERAQKIQDELADYQFAKNQQEIQPYRAFLQKYPESEYYFEMDTLCSNLAFVKAENANTLLGFKSFLDSFPNSKHRNSAVEKIIKLSVPKSVSSISKISEVNAMIAQIRKINNEYSLGLIFTSNQFATSDINSYYWTYKNLNVSHFANGDTIPQAKTNQEWVKAANDKKPAWCYIENNSEDSYNKGKLYNWYAVNDIRGLSASPMFIPIQEDFENLVSSIGTENDPAQKLKCPFSWEEEDDLMEIDGNLSFDATPTGYRDEAGNFVGLGKECRYWSNSDEGNTAMYLGLRKDETGCDITSKGAKGCGYTVRLVAFDAYRDYSVSPTLDSLFDKLDEFLLKEYSLIKDDSKVKPFLFNQFKNELGIKYLKEEEINQVNIQLLMDRFYNNENLIKNGNYLVPGYYADNMICGGDGFGGGLNAEIIHGFSNDIHNYIKWENGATYKGEIVNGFPNGKGVYVTGNDLETDEPGGVIFEGDFVDGNMTYGTIKYKDKRIYVGQCNAEQLPHGQGTMTLANGTKQTGTFEDGVFKKVIQIGNSIWMDKNLDVTTFRNGHEIKQVNNLVEWQRSIAYEEPAWCYENFDPSRDKIYNYYVIHNKWGLEIAPEGWHIPTFEEFNELGNFISANQKCQSKSCESEYNGYNETGRKTCTYYVAQHLRNSKGWALKKEKWAGGTIENPYTETVSFLVGKNTFDLNLKANCYIKNEYDRYSNKKALKIDTRLFECVLWSEDSKGINMMWSIGEETLKPIATVEESTNQEVDPNYYGNSIRCVKDK